MNDLMFYLLGIIKSAPKTNPIREDALLNSGLANPIDITDAIKDLKHLEYIKSPIGGNTLLVTSKGRIAYNEFDLVLFFNDPNNERMADEISYISRLCDQNNIPFASNIGTAEMLVLGLARGDLDWRNMYHPTNRPIA